MRSLPFTMGAAQQVRSRYLDSCRVKRNRIDYDGIGFATAAEADELTDEVGAFHADVLDWLARERPELLP